MEHTPTPWVADDDEGFSSWKIWEGYAPSGHGQPGRIIAEIPHDDSIAEIDAEFIVRACNSHDALLAVCKKFDAYWASGNFSRNPEMWQMLRDAIALAEKGGA